MRTIDVSETSEREHLIEPEEVAAKEFLIGMRGYVREEVHAFLRALAEEIHERDDRIAQLVEDLEEARSVKSKRSVADRLGEEVTAIVGAAGELAQSVKMDARAKLEEVHKLGETLVEVAQEAEQRFAITIGEVRRVLEWLASVAEELPQAPRLEVVHEIHVVSASA